MAASISPGPATMRPMPKRAAATTAADPPVFTPAALTFLRQLKRNNRREWFQPRKAEFEALLRQPMLALAGDVDEALRTFAVDYCRPAARAVQRIYRDVRFRKDKTPYKTNVSAMWPRVGLGKMSGASYYVGVSPDGVEVFAGLYGPGAGELAALRVDIDGHPERFRRLTTDAVMVAAMGALQGEQFVRVPKPYAADHPMADALRRRQFFVGAMLDAGAATRPGLRRAIVDRFRAAAPLVEHLNGVILAATAEQAADERPKRPTPMF